MADEVLIEDRSDVALPPITPERGEDLYLMRDQALEEVKVSEDFVPDHGIDLELTSGRKPIEEEKDTEQNLTKHPKHVIMNASSSEDENIFKAKDEVEEKLKVTPPWKLKIEKWLDSWLVAGVMTFLTIYALFFDDIRVLYVPMSFDDLFYGFTAVSLVFFTVEIVLASIVK